MTNGDDAAWYKNSTGLTKREYFAAMALQGMRAQLGCGFEEYAQLAVEQADALIAELNKDSVVNEADPVNPSAC